MVDESADGNLYSALRVREADLENTSPVAKAPR